VTTAKTTANDAHATIAGLVNLRDCGGLPTEDGSKTRPGVLYRSEAPRNGDHAPTITLGGVWPPPTVIDLRSSAEVDGAEHALIALGATVHHVPMLEELSPEEIAEHNADVPAMYRLFVSRCGGRLVEAFRAAVDSTDGPVLVHCAAGKDRTGIVVAMLLRSAGVTRQAVIDDYLQTNASLEDVLRQLGIEEFDDKYRVRAESIEQALEVMEYHPDGLHGWLTEYGLRPEELTAWRERLVDAS
jgi:protein-tyrosine phosphatase